MQNIREEISLRFKQFVICFIALFLTVISSTVLPLISYIQPQLLNNLSFKNAQADVGAYDISGGDIVSLAGEWQFFWDKHIVSDGLQNEEPDLYVDVPSAWTLRKIDGKKLPNGGIASYRAFVKNIDSDEPVIISIGNMPGKCSVYIDGKFVFSNRSLPGHNEGENVFFTYSEPMLIESPEEYHEVVVEVECEYSAGLTSLPELSTFHAYRHSEVKNIALRYMIIGIVTFFTVCVMLLLVFGKNYYNQFWVAVLCVAFVFRMLISNEGYIVSHGLFGDVNYEIMTSLMFVTTYIIKLSMLMAIINVLKIQVNTGPLVAIAVSFLICAFVPYFLYDYIYRASIYLWLQSVAYIVDVYLIYRMSGAVNKKRRFAIPFLVFYCITASAIVIDNFYLNGFISSKVSNIMPIACVCFISFLVLMHLISTVENYKKAQQAAEYQKELSEMSQTLMLSQIQPHFLYNALNTIKYMTKKDPKVAEGAIVKFSNYLRANMDSLTQKEPIAFIKELEHVKNYINIEELRFGDRLKIEYDIQCDNFEIPPLTIQPIVENAIKHGVNQRPEGGWVRISSWENGNSIFVCVEDNGVGYDVTKPKTDDRSHVGIMNITKRLEAMLNATVTVKSVIGEGTTVTVEIPKERGNNK